MKRGRRNSKARPTKQELTEIGRQAVESLIAAQERTGCKLFDLEIAGDDVIVKADYIRPIAEMAAELEAAGMSHDDAVQWGVRALRRKAGGGECR